MTGPAASDDAHETVGEPAEPQLRRWGVRELLQSIIGFAVAGTLLTFALPAVVDTTWAQIWDQFALVGLTGALLMSATTLAGLYCYTFTLTASLPGLSHFRALVVNTAGSMISNVLPLGGAAGAVLTYAMYRSWGFGRRAISTSLVVTGVWNLMARMACPVLALIVVLVGPVDPPESVALASALGAGLGIGLLTLFALMIYSETVSHAVGRSLGGFVSLFSRRMRSRGRLDDLIQDQRERMSDVVRTGGMRMTFGLVGMFAFLFGLYVVCCRTVDIDLSLAHLFAAYAVRQALTIIAITPGGIGVTEVGTAGVLLTLGADPAAASAAALLYAVFTHVLEVPVGLLAFVGWARRRTRAVSARVP